MRLTLPTLAVTALLGSTPASATTTRYAYETGYWNTNGGDWFRESNDEGTLLANRQSALMDSLASMYRTTGDPTYLDRLAYHVDGVLETRDDARHVIDYRGEESPCWQDLHYSYGWPYCWVLHSGVIIHGMVEFAWLVQEHDLGDELAYDGVSFAEKAAWYVEKAAETVAHHDAEWRDQGHYVFRTDAHFLQDEAGTINPLNCSNSMGRSLLRLWLVTGEQEYFDKVEKLALRFEANIIQAEGGGYYWPYYPDEQTDNGEDICHAGSELRFAVELYHQGIVFDDEDMRQVARTLTDWVSLDDRTLTHNLHTESEAAEDYYNCVYNWLPLTPWDTRIWTIVRNHFDVSFPADSIDGEGGWLEAWALLAEYEPVSRAATLPETAWPDPDAHAGDDWREAAGATPWLAVDDPPADEPCVVPLEVDSQGDVALHPPWDRSLEPSALWQATRMELTRWVPCPEHRPDRLDLALTLVHDPDAGTLEVRERPSFEPPTIESSAPSTATVGEIFEYQADGEGDDPLWWSPASFPTGARVDFETGLVSWTPTDEGDQDFVLQLENDAGSELQGFTVTVSPAAAPPPPPPAATGCSSTGRSTGGWLGLLAGALLLGTVRRPRWSLLLVLLAGCDACNGDKDDTQGPDTETGDTQPPDTETGETSPPDETGDTTPPVDTGPFDVDGDGYWAWEDCDDDDPAINPGAYDSCDDVDTDCDGVADDECATHLAVGTNNACAVMLDQSLHCWGSDSHGQSTPPDGTWSWVDLGYYHGCGVTTEGEAQCWGDDSAGQATPDAGSYQAVEASYIASLGLTSDGVVAHWGANLYSMANTPGGDGFVSLSCGQNHCCALRDTGRAECWGASGFSLSDDQTETAFSVLETGSNFNCGLYGEGHALCWGYSYHGQLEAPEHELFVSLSCGTLHCCGLHDDGTASCWGIDSSGQGQPPEGVAFESLSAGGYATMGLTADGTVHCWGSNAQGQCETIER